MRVVWTPLAIDRAAEAARDGKLSAHSSFLLHVPCVRHRASCDGILVTCRRGTATDAVKLSPITKGFSYFCIASEMHMHYIAMHMRDQITFRLPRDVARSLARRARERGVPKSQLVREAIERYLAGPTAAAGATATWERLAAFVGAVELDPAAAEHDALTRRIREHNWRQ